MRMVHRFCYPITARVDRLHLDELEDASSPRNERRRSKLHWLRDGDAGAYYVSKLASAGYQFALKLNLRTDDGDTESKADRAAAATERLKKGDVLLLNTRPPFTKDENQLLSPIERSDSWVENRIMEFLAKIFTTCSRDEVVLSRELAAQLPKALEKRAKVKFKTRSGAWYTHKATVDGEYTEIRSYRTAGYLIYGREIWPNGPDLLCSFAMSGPMNLIWAYLVASKFGDHLTSPGCERFLMADFGPPISAGRPQLPPESPDTLDFANRWIVEVALDTAAAKLWM